MKIYLVGGAVRDMLMGLAPKDYDYVVVGSTPEEMLSLGFTKVGADFPVFLHPLTKDEFALARTERKTGTGYNGFTCDWEGVTLEEDLSRRDLTINAMALEVDENFNIISELIDPFGGKKDLEDKVLRHVSPAFSEDPLRVLRVARFHARFGEDWVIDLSTQTLILSIMEQGGLKELTPERIWKETEKALCTKTPSLYFSTLHNLGVFPEYDALFYVPQRKDHHPEGSAGVHTDLVMDYTVKEFASPQVVFAALCHDMGKVVTYKESKTLKGHEEAGVPVVKAMCERIKTPNKFKELAMLTCKYHMKVHGVFGNETNGWTKPNAIMRLFEETKAMAKPARFHKLLQVCEADANGKGFKVEYQQREYLKECLKAAMGVNTKLITLVALKEGKSGKAIGELVRVAKIQAIREVQYKWKNSKNI